MKEHVPNTTLKRANNFVDARLKNQARLSANDAMLSYAPNMPHDPYRFRTAVALGEWGFVQLMYEMLMEGTLLMILSCDVHLPAQSTIASAGNGRGADACESFWTRYCTS